MSEPLSTVRCRVGWAMATVLLMASILAWDSFYWQQMPGDFNESAIPAFAMARGEFHCAYPTANQSSVPPLYPMVAASVIALTGLSNMKIPESGAAARGCPSSEVGAIDWHSPVLLLWPIGLLGWPVLLAGFVLVVRASGWGRTKLEVLGPCLMACIPALAGTLINYFHPEDLFAMGLILGALAAHLRRRWFAAGVLIGLACCAKQYAVLAALPLLVVTPSRDRWRLLLGAVGIGAIVIVPLGIATGRGMFDALLGTNATPVGSATVVARLGLQGAARTVVSRCCPLILAAIVTLWAQSRIKTAVRQPVVLTALLATSLALRLVFEVNTFDYYLMALSVALIVADVAAGSIRLETIAWILAAGTLYPPKFEPLVLVVDKFPVPAQMLVALSGLALAMRPLFRLSHYGSAVSETAVEAIFRAKDYGDSTSVTSF